MSTLPDFEHAVPFAIPVAGGPAREGMVIEGPQGWGEFGPGSDDDRELARGLTTATEPGTVGWPDPLRGRVPVAVTVAAVGPERARAAVRRGQTVDVVVGSSSLADDVARVEAVRDAVGPTGTVRCIARHRWNVEAAVAVAALRRAAGEVEFVELSACSPADVDDVRRRVDVRIAIDVAGYDESRLPLHEAADVAVLRTGPLGGVRRALRVAESRGLPCVVASSGESSVGVASGVALAGALPDLPFACGLGTIGLLEGDIVSDARSLLPVDGYLPVAPMPPGPDRERLERFSITDPEMVARWHERLRRARLLTS